MTMPAILPWDNPVPDCELELLWVCVLLTPPPTLVGVSTAVVHQKVSKYS